MISVPLTHFYGEILRSAICNGSMYLFLSDFSGFSFLFLIQMSSVSNKFQKNFTNFNSIFSVNILVTIIKIL